MVPEQLTPEMNTKVEELRSRVQDLLTEKMKTDESIYRRFLKARKYDVDAADCMLRKNIEWRKENNIDNILTDYKAHEVTKYSAISHIGFDKEGSPLIYIPFGKVDTKGILKVTSVNDALMAYVQHFERNIELSKEQSKKLNKPIEQSGYIMNSESFSFGDATNKPTIEFSKKLVDIFDANYPERLKYAYFINTSSVFTFFWKLLRPFLAEETSNKIHILGKDEWKEELLKVIDADVLPAFLGGRRTGPNNDTLCKDIIFPGGPVPEYYFPKKTFAQIPGSKKLLVHRLSKETIELEVKHPGSLIEWEFATKHRDIGFSLFYKENRKSGSAKKELIPMQRIDTEVSSDARTMRCEKTGLYVIEFNNTYSWIHSKEVYYSTKIVCSETD